MAGAGYYVFMEALHGGQHVVVPKVIDLPITEASLILSEQGLDMGKPESVPHPTVPQYHVITQRPEPGRVVRTGRKVYVTVSMGTEFLKAPDLLRRTLEDARQEIEQSRFRVGSLARIPSSTPRDIVLAQDPPPGRNIANQGEIHLLVSAGMESAPSFMPDIRGMGVQEALNLLTPFNVTLVPNVVDIPGAMPDVVLNQDPLPGTLVYQGQVVNYDVKPSGTINLPDARHTSEVRYVLNYDWFDRDVRVDLVDRRGNRQTVWSKRPAFDEQSRRTFVAGSAIRIPITYIGEVIVEIYVNDALVESYSLREGAEPVRKSTVGQAGGI